MTTNQFSVVVQLGEDEVRRYNVTTEFASKGEALDIALEYARDLVNGYVAEEYDMGPDDHITIDDLGPEARKVVESAHGATRQVRW